MNEHVFVKHTLTPVEVLTDDSGSPVVLVDPEEQQNAEVNFTVYGCDRCGKPLSEAHGTKCPGDEDN
jgi:hypothetical protein